MVHAYEGSTTSLMATVPALPLVQCTASSPSAFLEGRATSLMAARSKGAVSVSPPPSAIRYSVSGGAVQRAGRGTRRRPIGGGIPCAGHGGSGMGLCEKGRSEILYPKRGTRQFSTGRASRL